jgi:hypothetical protein
MNLGDILTKAAKDDMAGGKKNGLIYSEYVKDDKFYINLRCKSDEHAYIICSVPNKDSDEEKNYLRIYFLSMAFNAAIEGMKRRNFKKAKQ